MIDFSLYPNLNGNLGENKVQIPDGVTTFWPDGDALVGNFIYKNGKISGFVDTKALIANDAKSTTIPYDFFEANLENVREDSVKFNLGERCKYFTLKLIPKYKGCKTINDIKTIDANYLVNDIIDGVWNKDLSDLENVNQMFSECSTLVTFTSNLNSLTNGYWMFNGCSNLSSFVSSLNSLIEGLSMFRNCDNLSSFNVNLTSLNKGTSMFYGCSALKDFECKSLKSLTNGNNMFTNCFNLTKFDYDMSSLTEGSQMFTNCSSLTSFHSDLSSLTNGFQMFVGCNNLTTFSSNLKHLTEGYQMFNNCKNLEAFKIDLPLLLSSGSMFYYCSKLSSFNSILSSLTDGAQMFMHCSSLTSFKSNLKSLTNGSYMFFGCKLDTPSLKNIAETINIVTETPVIHIGIGNKTPSEEENTYLTQIHNKGWQVYVNGNTDSNIFNPTSLIPIDGEQILNPIPFWAKPVPSTQEEANYIDENGNYYNILGGQFIYVNDPESYGMFVSEDDAAQNMRLTKIEK